jgi:ABC-2 type transport system ATP-binding protein
MPPVFSLRHLDVRYSGGVHAVRDITLDLPQGHALALLGANGAGKSSLIGALLGMIPATGEGDILGAPLGKIPQRLFEKIGFVADGRTPPEHRTLREHLDYLRPLYPTWDEPFAQKLIARFDLPTDRKIGGFSRGMKMKASMVAALAFRPALLVLDEPFGGLDPLTREELIDSLLELMAGGDWSVLLSSHDIHEVERLCDRVAILEAGKITVDDDLEAMQRRFRRVTWEMPATSAEPAAPAGWLDIRSEDTRHSALQPDFTDEAATSAALAGIHGQAARLLDCETQDLRTILIAHLRHAKSAVSLR